MYAATSVPEFMPSHVTLVFLLQIGLLLLTATVFGRLAVRMGMPSVVGELCSGILLGPSVLEHAAPDFSAWLFPRDGGQLHLLDAVGQLGVLLLVGIIGVHLDMGLLRTRRATVTRISLCGLLVPLGLGTGVGFLLPQPLSGEGDRTIQALFLGVAMCVSAIPVIAKTLMDMGMIHRNVAQLTLAAGMVDDVFGWLMLSVLSAMATAASLLSGLLRGLAGLAVVLLVAALIGRPLVSKVFQWANRAETQAPAMSAVVILIVLSAAGTTALGLEGVFGAFVCGIMISRYGRPDPVLIGSLRSIVMTVLAPVFFATVGLRVDLTALADPTVLAVAALVLTVAVLGKFAGAYLGARLSRLTGWEALALGAGMNARGVIELIVATVGLQVGILSVEMYTVIVLLAVVTSLMAPPILRVAMAHIDHTGEEHRRERDLGLVLVAKEKTQ
ncbi:cation:proton antiporter [Streptomyces prunicolor]|uniref:Cation:proton antiporter n=1 Tax=Streptomyces prunicolor TaxID=67348 RepID=A0ABU4FSU4_9ACTN|nr:cation:proton antiporter [Streptomyces prunicolor]MCX5243625.1 cation:proton antiporter [Streptomyces prunicolor]MDV7223706.1 cation:proton antiporter [Streptomyces prunicolor]